MSQPYGPPRPVTWLALLFLPLQHSEFWEKFTDVSEELVVPIITCVLLGACCFLGLLFDIEKGSSAVLWNIGNFY
jgi:hypothetical protein